MDTNGISQNGLGGAGCNEQVSPVMKPPEKGGHLGLVPRLILLMELVQ